MKLALDAGHGRYTAGKRCLKSLDPKETREWILNDRICRYLQELLQKYNIEVLRLDDTTGNVDIPLSTRTSKANTWGSDFCLSIHHNAGAKGTIAGGITLHIDPNAKPPVPAYQKKLYDTLIKHTGLKGNRVSPLYTNDFSMTKYIKNQKSILIEHGFMDSKTDVPIILSEQFARNCAESHEEFLVTTFDLKLKGGKDMLQKGDKGSAVRGWQMLLILWNPLALPKYKADADFGGETEEWTKKFQVSFKLEQTGIVDDKTWDALIGYLSAKNSEIADLVHQLSIYDSDIKELSKALSVERNKVDGLTSENADLQTRQTELEVVIYDLSDAKYNLVLENEKLIKDLEGKENEELPFTSSVEEYSVAELLKVLIDRIFRK